MVEVDNKELVKEETPSEPTKAEEPKESAMEVAKEVFKIQEQKEQQNQKEPEVKKPKSKIDLTHFNAFKERITKDFGLTSKVDSAGHHLMFFKGFLVVKLLPRKKWWYGVCREVPEKDNIWKAFRINKAEDEKAHYEHIKKFVEINSEED